MCQKLKKYTWNILIALDQLLNVFLFGYPDETLSARAYRKAQAGQWFWRCLRALIDLISAGKKSIAAPLMKVNYAALTAPPR